ncbi:MAG: hypothetical protein IIT90_05655, partial [Clostridiales bacterium]|nr:hypothetical protein [Clostridiales bacterium]
EPDPTRGAPSSDAIDIDACTDVLINGCYMHVNEIMKAGIISQRAYWCFLRIFPFDSARIRIRPAVINVIPMI